MFQNEWQGIQFSDFAVISSQNLADSDFYSKFYIEFFKRYQNWNEISQSWRGVKEACADFVIKKCKTGKVLSVGCGLGFMEHYIRSLNTGVDLYVHDVTPHAWKWVGSEFGDDHKLLGYIPECLPKRVLFDLVYLSVVEYAFDTDSLVRCLADIRSCLVPGKGQLLIFGSLEDVPASMKGHVISKGRKVKAFLRACLEKTGLFHRGQFWGWGRTRKEFQDIMNRAGYTSFEEGFVGEQYWISGSC
ncbi:class I SAM-dependent methyltransferase [bacterium]|nr:class I SAM-dependent methyltransferase [bacterium]